MKKTLLLICAAFTVCVSVSCGGITENSKNIDDNSLSEINKIITDDNSESNIETETIPVSEIFYGGEEFDPGYFWGNSEEVPYEDILHTVWFDVAFNDYIDDSNVLQLDTGTFPDSAVAKPFKVEVIDETEAVGEINMWNFPVVHDGQCIGLIAWECRSTKEPSRIFDSSKSYSDKLNKALEKGRIALCCYNDGIFGVYEDNSSVLLYGEGEFTSSLTFNDIADEHNVLDSDSLNDIVFTVNDRLPAEEIEKQIQENIG